MIKFLFVIIPWMVILNAEFVPDGWRLVKEADGIQVYLKSVPGSEFSEIRGIRTVKTSLASLVAIWSTPEKFPEWLYTCRKGVILKKDTEKSLRIYMESQFPWPLHNRDNILLAELEQNPKDKKVTILLTGKPDSIEKKKGLVRVVKSFGKVEFTPLGDGEVQVVFDFFMDPGGAIAAPIINLFSVDFPFLSLKKMGEVVRQSEYQMAQFSFIQELP